MIKEVMNSAHLSFNENQFLIKAKHKSKQFLSALCHNILNPYFRNESEKTRATCVSLEN